MEDLQAQLQVHEATEATNAVHRQMARWLATSTLIIDVHSE
jgi:hypothetical protein